MKEIGEAQIEAITNQGGLHALYVVFKPGVSSARTIQVGNDLESHAYIDVDEDGFPIALELRGWRKVDLSKVSPPPMSKEKMLKILWMLTFDLLKEHKDSAYSMSKMSRIAEDVRELACV